MVDRAPVMVWTARPDTTLDYVNSTCAEFTGLPIEKLLDEGWLDAVHPDDRGPLRPASTSRRSRRAGHSSWSTGCAEPTAPTDGFWPRAFRSMDRTAASRVTSAATSTSPSAGTPKSGFARAGPPSRSSHREIQHLAGRLIEAQDAERARVARDLHDDVSQQLAGLSIAFSGLKQRMDELQVGEELQADLRALHQRTTTLAQSVRHLSHDLHPTVLRHAGLVAALTSYCAELERCARHRVDVQRGRGLRVHRPGGRALPLPDRAGSAAQRHRARRRQPGGRSAARARTTTRRSRSRTMARDSMSRARSSAARGWGWSASPSGSGSREAPSASTRNEGKGTRVRVQIPASKSTRPLLAPTPTLLGASTAARERQHRDR